MRGFGIFLMIVAALFFLGMKSAEMLHGAPIFGEPPGGIIGLLVWIVLWGIFTIGAGALAIFYAVLHAIVQNDVAFMIWATAGGVLLTVVGHIRSGDDSH